MIANLQPPSCDPLPLTISVQGVEKAYRRGSTTTPVLNGVDLAVVPGECVFLAGPSGSGKTTLLSILGCILSADRGRVQILGQDVLSLDGPGRVALRRDRIGFVFQRFHLIRGLTALENVCVPLLLREFPRQSRLEVWKSHAKLLPSPSAIVTGRLPGKLQNDDLRSLFAAALLHDIGHYAFSHGKVDVALIPPKPLKEVFGLAHRERSATLVHSMRERFGLTENEAGSLARICRAHESLCYLRDLHSQHQQRQVIREDVIGGLLRFADTLEFGSPRLAGLAMLLLVSDRLHEESATKSASRDWAKSLVARSQDAPRLQVAALFENAGCSRGDAYCPACACYPASGCHENRCNDWAWGSDMNE